MYTIVFLDNLFPFIIAFIGLFFGSFLNVLIDRIPQGKSFIKGRSYCDHCKKTLKWHDLLPLLSFFALKGKCRYCKKKISIYYPLVEGLTAVIFALTYLFTLSGNFQYPFYQLLFYLFISSAFIVIFFADLKYGIVPDKIVVPAIVVSLIYRFLVSSDFLIYLYSAIGASFFFFILFLITKGKGMGLGDVKLALLMGLILGVLKTTMAIYLAFLTGGVVSIILVLWGKKKFKKDTIPFAPFLIFATFLNLFLGNILVSNFLRILGL